MKELEVIKYIFKNLLKNTWKNRVILFFLGSSFLAFLTILEPLFFREIIKILENFFSTWEKNLEKLYQILLFWGIFIILFLWFKWIFWYKMRDILHIDYIKNFKNSSKKLLWISHNSYLNSSKWTAQKALADWTDKAFLILRDFFEKTLPSIFILFFVTIFLFYLNWKMALATISMAPFLIFTTFFVVLKTSEKQVFISEKWTKSVEIFADALTNNPLLKIFNLHSFFNSKISKNLNEAFVAQKKVFFHWSSLLVIQNFFVIIARFLVLWFWAYSIFQWNLDFASLFLFYAYIDFVYSPIINILQKIYDDRENLIKIWYLIDEIKNNSFDDKNDNWTKILEKISWEIEFKNVSFSYNDWKEVFKDLNFEIKKWEKVAFVWTTWAWKSTITNLLFRFWDINKWEISLDWNNIKNLTKENLRSHIGIVMQDNLLFNTSIKENLFFAKENATNEDLKKALKNAKADFVFDLKNWIDTKVWERWLKLSWWEKQRLSIARLFLKNPEIFILDEATSALDTQTEKLIQESLDKLMKWRTSIIIAHRLSTIKKADRIFVLEKWKIVESWKYEELLKNKSIFFNLVNPDKLVI